jgi:hypothetical protein
LNLLPDAELKSLIREAHSLVFASLTKKLQAELSAPAAKMKAKKPASKTPVKRAKA